MNFFLKIIIFFFFFPVKIGFSETSLKILIPNENYQSEEQKINEVINFEDSGLTEREWRIKKCYRNVVADFFWNSSLCPTDRSSCRSILAVEELQSFKKYYEYLLQISELCADGFLLMESDSNFFKKSTQVEVDRFIKHIRNTRKKKIDYSRPMKDKFTNNNKSTNTLIEPAVKNTDSLAKRNDKELENKKELELLKKQVRDLKKIEKEKQQEIERLRESEKKKLKELEMARKVEKKRLKEIEDAKKIEKKKEREFLLQKKLIAEEEKKIEQQKKLMKTEKKIEEIKKMIESNRSTKVSQDINVEINKKKINEKKKKV